MHEGEYFPLCNTSVEKDNIYLLQELISKTKGDLRQNLFLNHCFEDSEQNPSEWLHSRL